MARFFAQWATDRPILFLGGFGPFPPGPAAAHKNRPYCLVLNRPAPLRWLLPGLSAYSLTDLSESVCLALLDSESRGRDNGSQRVWKPPRASAEGSDGASAGEPWRSRPLPLLSTRDQAVDYCVKWYHARRNLLSSFSPIYQASLTSLRRLAI